MKVIIMFIEKLLKYESRYVDIRHRLKVIGYKETCAALKMRVL
jgi:hypothetical protein